MIVDGKKRCNKCKEWKLINEFSNNKRAKDGLQNKCKCCRAAYYAANREKIAVRMAAYRIINHEKLIVQGAAYRAANHEKLMTYDIAYRTVNRKKIAAYRRRKRQTDINYRITCNLRSRLATAIKNDAKTGSAVRDLGCTIGELKIYLENKFVKGMSWDNYGEWQLDHIKPLAFFDLTNREQLLEACHFTNLQPLWAADNMNKSCKPGKTIKQLLILEVK